ncbi:MAG: ribosomal protein S18-alanine N-acetyltransferase [Calditrichaceae bacterium]|nr:ribosomal protein S18-alanine N-acetyltransferase [Calditrichaceae bacterium]
MNILIRRMQHTDVKVVFDLETQIFSDPWTLESFRIEVENRHNSYPCVLLKDNVIAGYAVVWYYSGEIHIGNFAIHPEFRKQGLGKVLLENILNKFKDFNTAYLEVRKSNIAAINLYKKFAFTELYVREKYYSNKEDAIVMCMKYKH